jgi:hypothetical protein
MRRERRSLLLLLVAGTRGERDLAETTTVTIIVS